MRMRKGKLGLRSEWRSIERYKRERCCLTRLKCETPFERNSFSTLGFYLLSMDYSDTILCWETSYGVACVRGRCPPKKVLSCVLWILAVTMKQYDNTCSVY